jgi:hypothetical protein
MPPPNPIHRNNINNENNLVSYRPEATHMTFSFSCIVPSSDDEIKKLPSHDAQRSSLVNTSSLVQSILSVRCTINVLRVFNIHFAYFIRVGTQRCDVLRSTQMRIFKNIVLKGIFGCKAEELNLRWQKIMNRNLNNFHVLPDIVRAIRSVKMNWMLHVASMRKVRK